MTIKGLKKSFRGFITFRLSYATPVAYEVAIKHINTISSHYSIDEECIRLIDASEYTDERRIRRAEVDVEFDPKYLDVLGFQNHLYKLLQSNK